MKSGWQVVLAAFWLAGSIAAASSQAQQGETLFQRTQYGSVVKMLQNSAKDAAEWSLLGRSYFMLGEFKKAGEAFEKAAALESNSSKHHLWLGRAYGRRAETSLPITAPIHASKARQNFEKAVALDNRNLEAVNDLFEYYLNAPGFMGGGLDKAAQLTKLIQQGDPAEYHYAQAAIAQQRKEYNAAEQHLRQAMELAPKQIGRVIDLARFLARRGKMQESDAVFAKADKVAPGSPKLLFAKAATYIETKRNFSEAKQLLERYLQASLTPDDPPREQAQKLLQQVKGS